MNELDTVKFIQAMDIDSKKDTGLSLLNKAVAWVMALGSG